MKKFYIAACALLVIIGSAYLFLKKTTAPQIQVAAQMPTDDSAHVTQFISDFISAVKNYDDSTKEAATTAQQYAVKGIDLNNRSIKTAEEEAVLLQTINDFKNGNIHLAAYLNDPNPLIKLTAQSVSKSALSILQPNADMLQGLQDGDTQKMQSALAAETAAQNGAPNDMLQAIPIINLGLIMGLGPIEKEPPIGPIPYKISADQRNQLLAQIKNEFPIGVNHYNNDVYLLMVYGIQMVLQADTFEQLNVMRTHMTTSGAQ